MFVAWQPPPPKSVSMMSLTGSAAAEAAMTANVIRSRNGLAILILHSRLLLIECSSFSH